MSKFNYLGFLKNRKTVFFGVSLLSMSIANAAMAQIAPATITAVDVGAAAPLEVVVVTAQKRRENLQDTAISVSVLSNRALENRHVVSLSD